MRAAVEALADRWAEQAGEGSEAWRVFGPQTVSVPFAVETLRALLAAHVPSPLLDGGTGDEGGGGA